jgi:arylsulfatase A-like enzyme
MAAEPAPNVLLVLADQWRGSDQGWIGNVEVHTPHLDALAAGGVRVRDAFANSPVCGPSRGSLITGLLPHQHHVVANDLPLRAGLPTVADVLGGAGYRTGWIGKWHLDGLPRDKWVAPQRRRGFAYWAAVNCSHRYLDAHYYRGADPEPVPFTGYEPDVQTDLALEFLAGRDGGDTAQPFFLTVSYGPPHDPYPDVPQSYLDRYDTDRLTPRANSADGPPERERLRQYYAGITAVDEQLGRLLAALRTAGRLDDTLVVVTSDHGDMLGSHGRRAKQVPFEEAVRVPMVLSWPARLAPRDVAGRMGLVDLPTTILGLVGADPLPGAYGRDLSPALTGRGVLREAVLLSNSVSFDEGHRQGVPEWRGFRDGRHTYARLVDGSPWLLFDDDADPWQQHNLVDDPVHADTVRAADARLDGLLAEAGDEPAPAAATLERLGLVADWNAREVELHGAAARTIAATTAWSEA